MDHTIILHYTLASSTHDCLIDTWQFDVNEQHESFWTLIFAGVLQLYESCGLTLCIAGIGCL